MNIRQRILQWLTAGNPPALNPGSPPQTDTSPESARLVAEALREAAATNDKLAAEQIRVAEDRRASPRLRA